MEKIVSELKKAIATFKGRDKVYGSTYKTKGAVLSAIFKDGITLKTPEEFNRFLLVVSIIGKIMRYSNQLKNGGHYDSAHDAIVYAAMLCEATEGKDETQ